MTHNNVMIAARDGAYITILRKKSYEYKIISRQIIVPSYSLIVRWDISIKIIIIIHCTSNIIKTLIMYTKCK